MQFYNQGIYTTCESLISKSGGAFPGSSLLEIPKHGVPLSKLVIGKPATSADATNGYMSPAKLASCLGTAHAKGWKGGLMVWQVRRARLFHLLHCTFLGGLLIVSHTVPPRQRRLDQVGEGQGLLNALHRTLARLGNNPFLLIRVARIYDRHDHTRRRTSLYHYFSFLIVLRS